MANWDEDSGYYCLLIAILCNRRKESLSKRKAYNRTERKRLL